MSNIVRLLASKGLLWQLELPLRMAALACSLPVMVTKACRLNPMQSVVK